LSLETPETVRKLQRAFYVKAKEHPSCRFHQLYDKVYRWDILKFAFWRCVANCRDLASGGAAGVDGQTFEQIFAYGWERWLSELVEELRKKGYKPQAVRRVWIRKANGGKRPLGIATIKDRVVQMAIVIVIEPIFEADLEPEQYGYRRERSAQDAVRAVHSLLNQGYRDVIDADLSGYFDSIPHVELIQCVARRISDREMLALIKRFLKARASDRNEPEQPDKPETSEEGTPQGSPLSPLLANLYIRRFILGWKKLGLMERFQARIVNYADDFVVCCRGRADEALVWVRAIIERLKLRINESKTQIHRVPEESIDFLGYTLGRCYSKKTGKSYIGTRPSKKKIFQLCRAISEETTRKSLLRSPEEMVRRLNRKLRGWSNYFHLGPVSSAYRAVDQHTRYRLRQWLRRKHQGQSRPGVMSYPDEYLYDSLGLVRLERRTRNFPWATA
jgi:group II intron reverse transcriptase/maturase